jgi:flagellin FlaB
MIVAVSLAAMIMTSGFTSSDVTKEVLMEALDETRQGLEVQGKISGVANIANDEVLTTATPITVATGGHVDLFSKRFQLSYKMIRVDSSEVVYKNIHAGVLNKNSYNSINDAMIDAKNEGLVEINPYVDAQKPTTTSAFVYWIINVNEDDVLDDGELAVIAIVYADQDRPHTGEYIRVEGYAPEGKIFTMERYIPNISGTIIDLYGKIVP